MPQTPSYIAAVSVSVRGHHYWHVIYFNFHIKLTDSMNLCIRTETQTNYTLTTLPDLSGKCHKACSEACRLRRIHIARNQA